MKLKSITINNYKCIIKSDEFSINDVTCLVGKNESGKSAILQALYKLKPIEVEKDKFDYLDEYPRNELSEYEALKDVKPANVLETNWELDQSEIKILESKFGVSPLKSNSIVINKGYSNIRSYEVQIDESSVLDFYLTQLSSDDKSHLDLSTINAIAELKNQLENLKDITETQASVLNTISGIYKNQTLEDCVIKEIDSLLPTFVYFPEYEKMAGKVAINTLEAKINQNKLDLSEKIFIALLELAGTTYKEIQQLGTLEHLIAKLEGISNRLSKEIFNYWSQNKNLKVIFRFDNARTQDPAPYNTGYIFLTRIENKRHGVSVSFDERSSGFIWFFSFLVWFSQAKKNYGDNLFILLDEPGLNLHAKAQADLLRYFREKLVPNFQLIYTTHSPFMIDPENLLATRTVEDVVKNDEILGTKVGDKILSTDSDTIFPLQAALGYDITQTLFVGKNTLLVEGPSDLLYLKWYSDRLKQLKREHLNPDWTVTPSGGIDKIGSFLTLFSANKLNVAIFTDFHQGDKKKVKSLIENEILKTGQIFTADMFVEQDEADIEDLIGRTNYLSLVNECYNLTKENRLSEKKSDKTYKRVIEEVEVHFRTMTDSTPMFDHYTPSRYLIENSSDMVPKLKSLEESLDRFEKLFKELNKLL